MSPAEKFIKALPADMYEMVDNSNKRRPTIKLTQGIRFATGWIKLQELRFSKLPVDIDSSCNLTILHTKLTSLVGIPLLVKGRLWIDAGFLSLEELNTQVEDVVFLASSKLTSLNKISKNIHSVSGGVITFDAPIQSHILDLLRVVGLQQVEISPNARLIKNTERQSLSTAFAIINNHLNTEERDVLSCQQELIAAGLKEFAKL